MIFKKEVEHIAKLARLDLTASEMKKFQKELSLILDYIKLLKTIDISKVKPTSYSRLIKNVTREDKAKKQLPEVILRLVEAAPRVKKGYIKVKSVF